jgi:hypothetical protein
LLGRPLGHPAGRRAGGASSSTTTATSGTSVVILPNYADNQPEYTGCGADAAALCPPHGSSSVWLRTEPRDDAPLVKDIGRHPTGDSLTSVYDHSARATAGQRYALADRQGDWTAIWYLGQKAWFSNPADRPTGFLSGGPLVTPKPGLSTIPVYGKAYPEPEAYPEGVPVQPLEPLQYAFPAGQAYALGLATKGEYYRAVTFDSSQHVVVRGGLGYYQIQFGHRVMYVKAEDVRVLR